ncbi:MAG: hypothetical protein ACYCQJ_12180 [Nitrososphaerales archaeon]
MSFVQPFVNFCNTTPNLTIGVVIAYVFETYIPYLQKQIQSDAKLTSAQKKTVIIDNIQAAIKEGGKILDSKIPVQDQSWVNLLLEILNYTVPPFIDLSMSSSKTGGLFSCCTKSGASS